MTTTRETRRADIVRAACEEFCESGFDRARIGTIAQRAGIGKSTIYEYFPSKTDLLLAVGESIFQQAQIDLGRVFAAEHSFREILFEYLRYMRSLILKAGPGLMNMRGEAPCFEVIRLYGERFRDFLIAHIAQAAQQAQRRGEISEAVEPDAAARLVVSMSSPIIPITDSGWEQTIRQCLDVLFEGLRPR